MIKFKNNNKKRTIVKMINKNTSKSLLYYTFLIFTHDKGKYIKTTRLKGYGN